MNFDPDEIDRIERVKLMRLGYRPDEIDEMDVFDRLDLLELVEVEKHFERDSLAQRIVFHYVKMKNKSQRRRR